MGIRYLNGIPFISVSGSCKTDYPVNGNWSLSKAQTISVTGLSNEELGSLFGVASNPTLWSAYNQMDENNHFNFGSLGYFNFHGTVATHVTGMKYIVWDLYNGNDKKVLSCAAVATTGIYYPNEANAAVDQWLCVGLVDSNNDISFASMKGCYGDVFGLYPSNSAPCLQSNVVYTLGEGVTIDDLAELLKDGDWSDDPTPPSPSEEGGFNLDNRFSPGIATNAIGLYPLTQKQVVDCFDNFWNTTLSETIRKALGIVDTTNELILGLKWFYGIKSDISKVSSNCYVTIANQKFDGEGCKSVVTKPCAKEFCTHDCGTINVPAHFNNYLDFMSKYELYVPFYGYVELNPSDVVGGKVGLKYNINLLTGDALAYITVNNSRSANIDEIAIPISALGVDCPTEHGSLKDTISNSARVIAGAAAAGVGIAAGMRWVQSEKIISSAKSRQLGLYMRRDTSHLDGEPTNAGMLATSMNSIESLPTVQRGSNVSGSVGYIGPLKPFLIITRPVKATPNTLNNVIGSRSCEVAQLSSKHGFVKASAIKPGSISTSCKYINEIIALVQSGVVMP